MLLRKWLLVSLKNLRSHEVKGMLVILSKETLHFKTSIINSQVDHT